MDRVSSIRSDEVDPRKLRELKIDPRLVQLIQKTLKNNPEDRPGHQEILEHETLQQLDDHIRASSVKDHSFKLRLRNLKRELALPRIEQSILK